MKSKKHSYNYAISLQIRGLSRLGNGPGLPVGTGTGTGEDLTSSYSVCWKRGSKKRNCGESKYVEVVGGEAEFEDCRVEVDSTIYLTEKYDRRKKKYFDGGERNFRKKLIMFSVKQKVRGAKGKERVKVVGKGEIDLATFVGHDVIARVEKLLSVKIFPTDKVKVKKRKALEKAGQVFEQFVEVDMSKIRRKGNPKKEPKTEEIEIIEEAEQIQEVKEEEKKEETKEEVKDDKNKKDVEDDKKKKEKTKVVKDKKKKDVKDDKKKKAVKEKPRKEGDDGITADLSVLVVAQNTLEDKLKRFSGLINEFRDVHSHIVHAFQTERSELNKTVNFKEDTIADYKSKHIEEKKRMNADFAHQLAVKKQEFNTLKAQKDAEISELEIELGNSKGRHVAFCGRYNKVIISAASEIDADIHNTYFKTYDYEEGGDLAILTKFVVDKRSELLSKHAFLFEYDYLQYVKDMDKPKKNTIFWNGKGSFVALLLHFVESGVDWDIDVDLEKFKGTIAEGKKHLEEYLKRNLITYSEANVKFLTNKDLGIFSNSFDDIRLKHKLGENITDQGVEKEKETEIEIKEKVKAEENVEKEKEEEVQEVDDPRRQKPQSFDMRQRIENRKMYGKSTVPTPLTEKNNPDKLKKGFAEIRKRSKNIRRKYKRLPKKTREIKRRDSSIFAEGEASDEYFKKLGLENPNKKEEKQGSKSEESKKEVEKKSEETKDKVETKSEEEVEEKSEEKETKGEDEKSSEEDDGKEEKEEEPSNEAEATVEEKNESKED